MVGRKVQVRGSEHLGFGEIDGAGTAGTAVSVRFYTGPTTYTTLSAEKSLLRLSTPLPAQTRCFLQESTGLRIGRVLGPTVPRPDGGRTYWVQFPNAAPAPLAEEQFRVIAYEGEGDPVTTLSCLAHETPFFAAKRLPLFQLLLNQRALFRGMTGLASARIELFEHQVEIVRRILLDPTLRYLLADEVGLGKTIEAGIILAQLLHDSEDLRAAVYVPRHLCDQWRDELDRRFELTDVPVLPHEDLAITTAQTLDLLIVDEAHRIVAVRHEHDGSTPGLSSHLRQLALRTPRVLLLTATPILSRDQELLSLLSILDPDSFNEAGLDAFRRVLRLRQDIGRSLMALENVTLTSMIRNQVNRVGSLLADDPTVSSLCQAIGAAIDKQDRTLANALLAELRSHLAETYRIHRRMLRTRRKALSELQGIGAQRSEQPVEFHLDDEYRPVWEALEEYRIAAAADTPESSATRVAEQYVRLGELITASPLDAAVLCGVMATELSLSPSARHALRQLQNLLAQPVTSVARFELLHQVLCQHLRKHPHSRTVVFCSSRKTSDSLGQFLTARLPPDSIVVASLEAGVDFEAEILRFREDANCRVLISDATLEEGRNLQHATDLVLFDLPLSPMRVEQRIGRLDRLDRVDLIPIKTLLSIDEEDLALDTAWYRCLVEGLSLFEAPLSDLQLLIDDEWPRIVLRLFRDGPIALSSASTLEELRKRIAEERERIAEQDIVDGLRLDTADATTAWSDVQSAERLAGPLTFLMAEYLRESLKLDVHRFRDGPGLSYSLRDRHEPLIPADKLLFLTTYSNREFTASRPRVTHHDECELLRSGHPVIEGVRRLLQWDDRGRAFAFWRRAPMLSEPELLFRVWVVVSADTSSVQQRLTATFDDAIARASLERLLVASFPQRVLEFCLDAYGMPASIERQAIIAATYDNAVDINLGGARSHALLEAFGVEEWPAMCKAVAATALQSAKSHPSILKTTDQARMLAAEQFRRARLRLAARVRTGADGHALAQTASKEIDELAAAVDACLACPVAKVDTLGAYVLSGEPICPR
jgi:ATP-dependent helicase HepA